MAASGSGILPRAVEFVLDNWTVLQLAVQHGFGGVDSRDKVFWLKDVIVQVLTDNHKVEHEELEDYISEILYNEFDTVVEDGSLEKISQKLSQFQTLWRAGNTENIEKEIQSVAPVQLTQSKKVENEENECEEDMEEPLEASQHCMCEGAASSNSPCPQCSSIQEGIGSLSIASNSQEMPQNTTDMRNDEEEEGWEVVRRSKKR